jgi:DNA-binding transcriptional regulator YiaG
MQPDTSRHPKRPIASNRPFPWRCRHCGRDKVFLTTTSYDAEARHDGRSYTFTIPTLRLPICEACGEKVFTEDVDEQINAALHAYLNYLTPEAMRAALERIRMTQKEVAERLGIAEATLSRWLTGTQMQTRAMDNFLRVFFAFPAVRAALSGDTQDPLLGSIDLPRFRPTDPPIARADSAPDVSPAMQVE